MPQKFDKINTTRLKMMVKNDDLVIESLQILLKNLTIEIHKIKKHLSKKEYSAISEICHKIKFSTHLISLDLIDDEINELSKKNTTINESQFVEYCEKVIFEIEKIIK